LFGSKALISFTGVNNMTLTQIEQRVKVLEQTVAGLAKAEPSVNRKWYRTHAGRFANDPIFDQIAELGREYRKSQRPARKTRRS
jgi:hypothetical protein